MAMAAVIMAGLSMGRGIMAGLAMALVLMAVLAVALRALVETLRQVAAMGLLAAVVTEAALVRMAAEALGLSAMAAE